MQHRTYADKGPNRPGVVLLITLVILVILSTLTYTLSAKVAARRHRNSYLVDYTQAQYACDSAMKYALFSLNNLDATLISRPNAPDFSDVFAMSDSDYHAMLAQFAGGATSRSRSAASSAEEESITGPNDASDSNATSASDSDEAGPNVPGPYGPVWPLVASPLQMEIASAQVKIEVEDENAKYPLGWAMMVDEKLRDQAGVSLATFCEWMGYGEQEISDLRESLIKVNIIRPFKVELTPLSVAMPTPVSIRTRSPAGGTVQTQGAPVTSRMSVSSRGGVIQRPPPRRTVSVAEQAVQQSADMARLLGGGLINTDLLSRPTVPSSERTETAMKYLGLWGARQVNVNTAPRHVLEAALTFGSIADAPKMASAIIAQRRIKPFESIDEVKKILFRYSDSVDKCRDFITTTSTIFTIRVTAVSGVAKVVAVAGITKEGRQVKRIAVMSD
jgi:hypothetical protein